MTPIGKGADLIATYLSSPMQLTTSQSKMCAFICANEIISSLNEMERIETGKMNSSYNQKYWEEVKTEIDKF